ncbi:hypothetical protein [Clostridium sp. M14]|uniref:beta barrel domain-containing protein n=1 Tax=Clostridium sp. M14 TaxID=2716311 RepID=UPI0013EE7D86|nr:hypothetical protein [Clostridium sp. M14]MBZ9693326.1 DUF5067 domain-containing protein [Clostridium sp. M14]
MFKVGNKAWMVTEKLYSGRLFKEVKITYVGRKIIRASDGDREIEFKNGIGKSSSFGVMYRLYESVYQYKNILESKKLKENIIGSIEKNLKDLSIEKLKQIKEIIKEEK